MKLSPATLPLLFILAAGCSSSTSEVVHKVGQKPKTVNLGFLAAKYPDDAGETQSHKEQFYVYQFDMPKDKVLEMIGAESAIAGWKRAEHNRFTIFSNHPTTKTELTVGAARVDGSNALDVNKTTLTINEFEK